MVLPLKRHLLNELENVKWICSQKNHHAINQVPEHTNVKCVMQCIINVCDYYVIKIT